MDADEITFSALFERHRRALQAHCYRMVGSFEDSEDLVLPRRGGQALGLTCHEHADWVSQFGRAAIHCVGEHVGRAGGQALNPLRRAERWIVEHHRGAHERGAVLEPGAVLMIGHSEALPAESERHFQPHPGAKTNTGILVRRAS